MSLFVHVYEYTAALGPKGRFACKEPYCAPEEREVVQKGDRGVKPYRLLTLVYRREFTL